MNEFDKPTYLRKDLKLTLQQLPIDKIVTLDSSIGDKIVGDNRHLKQTLRELLASANHNQQTQEKFFELELYLLESRSYKSLLNRVLLDLKQRLNLSQVELFILDPDKEIQLLISEIYGQLEHSNLFYIDSMERLNQIYSEKIDIVLSQQQTIIEKLFNNQPAISQSIAKLPLFRGTQVIGSLHLGSEDKQRFNPELASNFLQHLASIISVCFENSINQERYKHLSLVDILTRAKNRRFFFQMLAKEIARSTRSNQPLSCLFIDIDHFKNINDQRGHLTGDRALREVAHSIKPLLRQSDILARFGGEEFTVLLPDSDSRQAAEIAERIRSLIEALTILDDQEKPFKLTISIGVSAWHAASQNFESADAVQNYLISQADKAVYQAKADGRNCVRISAH